MQAGHNALKVTNKFQNYSKSVLKSFFFNGTFFSSHVLLLLQCFGFVACFACVYFNCEPGGSREILVDVYEESGFKQ